jgi:hypothetical protein
VRAVDSFLLGLALTLIIVRWGGKSNKERERTVSLNRPRRGREKGEGSVPIHVRQALIKLDITLTEIL